MRRAVFGLAVTVVLVLATPLPAISCHFGVGVNCGAPEDQPFNPQSSVTLADNRTSAHSDMTYRFTQNAHEQFVVSLAVDFAPEFGIDLDVPAFNEKIADLEILAIVSAAQTTITGRIFDHNDAAHGHPAGGVYHWLVEIDPTTPTDPPSTFDAFADTTAGHFHFEFDVPDSLLQSAQTADASLLEVRADFFDSVAAGPFLTNPAAAGTYQVMSTFTAWDDPDTPQTPPTKTHTANVTVAARVPTTVTLAPANQTLRIGEQYTATATVKDQAGEAIPNADVDFDVTAGPHTGPKCQNVLTNGAGQASCSYTETTGGTDTVRATATANGGSKSATATVKWRAPTGLTLLPESATKRVGESITLTATLTDQDGTAMAGEAVTFTRTGANPGSQTVTTDAQGRATHSYSGSAAGDDTVTATSSSLSDASTITWYVPVPTTVTLDPSTATRNTGQSHAVTATVLDQQARAMAGETVAFQVTEGPHAGTTGSGTTDAAGKASFSYTGSADGTDTISATAGSVTATATVAWQTQTEPDPADRDGDGIRNTEDNCSFDFNPDQADNDGDNFGDVCDPDDDNDSLQDVEEGPRGCDPFKRDTDSDGLTDWQEKGFGTNCADPDSDDDGASDGAEKLQMGTDPNDPDHDNDGVLDGSDNCPRISNPDQADNDQDGIGNACDGSPNGSGGSGVCVTVNGTKICS